MKLNFAQHNLFPTKEELFDQLNDLMYHKAQLEHRIESAPMVSIGNLIDLHIAQMGIRTDHLLINILHRLDALEKPVADKPAADKKDEKSEFDGHEQLTIGKYQIIRHDYDGDMVCILRTAKNVEDQSSVFVREVQLENLLDSFYQICDREQNKEGKNILVEENNKRVVNDKAGE